MGFSQEELWSLSSLWFGIVLGRADFANSQTNTDFFFGECKVIFVYGNYIKINLTRFQ